MIIKLVYKELDELASQIKEDLIVLSDHGMYAVGQFGDHSTYGFWSTSFKKFSTPKITEFRKIILDKK